MSGDDFSISAIDDVIHGRLRLGIMAYLSTAGRVDFTHLKKQLEATDGNLSIQMRKLEDAGFVSIEKSFVGRKPQTIIGLTQTGREAFINYLKTMKALVDRTQS